MAENYDPDDAAGALALAVDGCRALAAAGQADMVWGHPSVRDPEGRGVWMKASGWGFVACHYPAHASRRRDRPILLISVASAVALGAGIIITWWIL